MIPHIVRNIGYILGSIDRLPPLSQAVAASYPYSAYGILLLLVLSVGGIWKLQRPSQILFIAGLATFLFVLALVATLVGLTIPFSMITQGVQ
ncbi:MAG: hypothetical protein ACAI34_02595 [Verrucomicrobium sp.]|nr:hypothetical protein [Verrucomicrobium sp.]